MKTYQCSCGRKREVEDYITLVGCPECQKLMIKINEGENGREERPS